MNTPLIRNQAKMFTVIVYIHGLGVQRERFHKTYNRFWRAYLAARFLAWWLDMILPDWKAIGISWIVTLPKQRTALPCEGPYR